MKLQEIYDQLVRKYGNVSGEMVTVFSDKGSMHSYIDYYERHFEPRRDQVRLLEIGVMTGGSLLMWQRYFKRYELYGVDIAQTWNQHRPFQAEVEADANTQVFFGVNSTRDDPPADLAGKQFDFIIDDGDHAAIAQMDTFRRYWPLLAQGGAYFIEDVTGPAQIEMLKNFIARDYPDARMDHYQGFKNRRADDQILTVYR